MLFFLVYEILMQMHVFQTSLLTAFQYYQYTLIDLYSFFGSFSVLKRITQRRKIQRCTIE